MYSYFKKDKIFASDLYGVYYGSLSACHVNRIQISRSYDIVSITYKVILYSVVLHCLLRRVNLGCVLSYRVVLSGEA